MFVDVPYLRLTFRAVLKYSLLRQTATATLKNILQIFSVRT